MTGPSTLAAASSLPSLLVLPNWTVLSLVRGHCSSVALALPDEEAPTSGLLAQEASAMALGTHYFQRELAREVENRRAIALKRLISLLPAGDPRRESFEERMR